MEVKYLQQALNDIEFWKKTGNKFIQKKVSQIVASIEKSPFEGIGKSEALKYEHSGKWFRRINEEHRIIYSINEGTDIIFIHSLKGHY